MARGQKKSRYARKKQLQKSFISKGGTWQEWVRKRRSGEIRI
jgi:hypothetical protein